MTRMQTVFNNGSRWCHYGQWRTLAMGALLVAATVGCGSDGMVSVTGEVTYQGKPLEYGTITFLSPGTRQATGEIDEGKIVRVTTKDENDGLAPGDYHVAISALNRDEKYHDTMVPPSVIPREYADIATSGLTATIEPGKKNELKFVLK